MDPSRPAALIPELVTVPAGPFMMGSDDGEDDERPAHLVEVAEFQIGIQPVTNEEYARFVRESGHREPAIHELPLVVSAAEVIGRPFRQTASVGRRDLQPPASGRSSGHARSWARTAFANGCRGARPRFRLHGSVR